MVADALKNDQTLKFAVFTSFSFVLSSGMWYIFFSGLLSGSGFTVYWLTSLGIVSSLSCMMLLSPFIFAVAAICALTGFGKKGRLFFVSAMMTMLVPPFDHIQQNFRHFGDSVICNIDLFTKLIEYRIKFQVEPIMTLAPQFSKLRYESGEIDRRVQDLLAPVSNNLGINIRKKIFDEAKKREYNFHYTTIPPKPTESQPLTKPTKKPWYRLAKERESRRKEREKQGKSNEPGVQSNKEKFRGLSDEAQKFNDMADNVCGNMTKDAETRCEDKCAEAIASCKAIVNKDWKRKFANLFIDFIGFCEKAIGSRCVPSCVKPRQKMDYFCKMRGEDDGEASKANMEELLDRYSKAAKEGATSFLLDYEILLNTPKANLNVPTFNGFAIQLKQNFSGLHRLFRAALFIFRTIMLMELMRKFKKGNDHVHNFLTNEEYRNNRVTGYFQRVDEELNKNNPKLMPFNKFLVKKFKLVMNAELFSAPSKKEIKGMLKPMVTILAVAIFCAFIHVTDALIAQMLNRVSDLYH